MDEELFAPPRPSNKGGEGPLLVSPAAGGTAVAPPPPSGAETAHRLFAEEVGRLPGVLRLERWGPERSDPPAERAPGGGSAAPTFHIYVRPNDREAEYAVYELQGQVYDRFPEAYLEVVVLDAIGAPCPDGDPGSSAAS